MNLNMEFARLSFPIEIETGTTAHDIIKEHNEGQHKGEGIDT